VTQETVSYTLPGKDVMYQLNKTKLIKICYGDGKVAESTLVGKKAITNIEDWKNVTLSLAEEDVHGLFKVGQIAMLGSANSDQGKDCR